MSIALCSFLDNLFSENDVECLEATNKIKNLVIGSNKQKKFIIQQGIVPRLLSLLKNEDKLLDLRLSALVIIGSLAKGTASEIQDLDTYETAEILLHLALSSSSHPRIIETCLRVLTTILQYPDKIRPSFFEYSEDICTVSRLIHLAPPDSNINCQLYVASILHSFIVQGNAISEIILTQAGGIPFLARLIQDYDSEDFQLPVLKCFVTMCYSNRHASDIMCATKLKDKPILDIIASLISRVNTPAVQLNASKCLTYIHRSGSSKLTSDDRRIVYKALPCLARLVAPTFDEEIRSDAASTLAYLTEADSELQNHAAFSNNLVTSLVDLLNCSNLSTKEAALKCLASLTANDEQIRTQVIDTSGVIDEIYNALQEQGSVKDAALRCLRYLSLIS